MRAWAEYYEGLRRAARSERRKRARLRCHALEAPALQVQHGGDHRQTVSGRKQGIVACA